VRYGSTERAASRLDAAVTAEMIISVSATASAAERASPTPILSPAAFSRAPSAAGNRMSQATMRSMPPSRSPEAIACPASPKPMKETRGVLRRVIMLPS
jgi:hypothetical protein